MGERAPYQVEIAVTNACLNFESAREVNPRARAPNLGEQAAVEVIEEPGRLQDAEKAILLCEETAVMRRIVVQERDKIVELTTMDFLTLLEEGKRIQSAELVFDRAVAAVIRHGPRNLPIMTQRSATL